MSDFIPTKQMNDIHYSRFDADLFNVNLLAFFKYIRIVYIIKFSTYSLKN